MSHIVISLMLFFSNCCTSRYKHLFEDKVDMDYVFQVGNHFHHLTKQLTNIFKQICQIPAR